METSRKKEFLRNRVFEITREWGKIKRLRWIGLSDWVGGGSRRRGFSQMI